MYCSKHAACDHIPSSLPTIWESQNEDGNNERYHWECGSQIPANILQLRKSPLCAKAPKRMDATEENREFPNRTPVEPPHSDDYSVNLCTNLENISPDSENIDDGWLREACSLVPELGFSSNVNLINACYQNLSQQIPCKTMNVKRDGNCLFETFSFLLTGSPEHATTLRAFICSKLFDVPFEPIHFVAQHGNFCNTPAEYLHFTKMQENGVYGGDIEITVFSTIFKVCLLVFVSSVRKWVVYKGFNSDTSRRMFIEHDRDHWEPISCVKSHGSLCNTHQKPHFFKRQKKTIETDRLINESENIRQNSFGEKASNFSVDLNHVKTKGSGDFFADFIKPNICNKCRRNSTFWYPLELTSARGHKVAHRKFGNKIDSDDLLCKECHMYSTGSAVAWKNAWPSVFFELIFRSPDKAIVDVFFKLPIQVQCSWFFEIRKAGKTVRSETIFQDITRDFHEFTNLIETYLMADYLEAMDKYPFPSIRCFCGASEFIERTGNVQFNHILNFVQPNFIDFKSNWRANVRCIRADFFQKCDVNLVFSLEPAIRVTEKGLCVSSCNMHVKGSKFSMFHVPRHPVVANICPPNANRLSPLVPSLRGVLPTKVGEFSQTFTMSQSVGGQNGVGCLTLHSFRNLNIKSNFLLPALESTFLHNRRDMIECMNNIGSEYNLAHADLLGFYGNQMYTAEEFKTASEAATYVGMSQIMSAKALDANEKSTEQQRVNVVENNCSEMGANALSPPKSWFTMNFNATFFLFLLLNVTRFSDLIKIGDTSFWEIVACLKEKLIKRVCNPKELFSKLHDKLGTNSKFDRLQFWRAVCSKVTTIQLYDISESLQPSRSLEHSKEIIIYACKRSSTEIVPHELQGSNYELVAGETTSLSQLYNLFVYRYLPKCSTILYSLSDGKTRISGKTEKIIGKISVLIYVRKCDVPKGIMNLVSGQDKILCSVHSLLLCCDGNGGKFKCSAEICKLQSRWRCPQKGCFFALCKKHFQETEKSGIFPKMKVFLPHIAEEEECSNYYPENEAEETEELDNVDVFQCLEPVEVENYVFEGSSHNLESNTVDTDASAKYWPVVQESKSQTDTEFLPVQVLFNVLNSVLVRPRNPIQSNLRFKRFLQSFVARSPSSSISLVQMEALLFPAIFYFQVEDGVCPGAMPFFIYSDKSRTQKLGYAGLLEHFRTRIADVTLLTSSCHSYIQFAVDCLVNLQLNNKHSQTFFQRGIQSLKLYDKEVQLFKKEINFVTNDTEKCVRQLSAAISSNEVTFFLTLTCNQKMHPGISPLLKAIGKCFEKSDEEIRENAVPSYMSTLVRCWSRSVQFLLNLITKSKERILGQVEKIWGRAEFQTSTGNLPHYHVLLWVKPDSYDVDELIQCSTKSILWAIRKLAQSSLKLVENTEKDVQSLYNLCVDLHTHCCARGQYRCHKRIDVDGNKICRTPPYPQSHHHWVMEIEQQYPREVLKYLEKLGFAEYNEGVNSKTKGILKCEKFMYAAEKGEHILPVCIPLFAVTKSSTNLLRVLFKFSASYLTSYAGKNEEHADAKILSSAGGKNFRLRNEGIQNKSLTSVKQALEHDKKNEREVKNIRCQLLAITESVFWLFGEPYVFHNMEFIHVQNVPVERRYVSFFKSNVSECSNLCVYNFRRFIVDLPLFRKLTANQECLLKDNLRSCENPDAMSAFSLRPPELLCISNVKLYYTLFKVEKLAIPFAKMFQRFTAGESMPWINCLGYTVRLRSCGLDILKSFLENSIYNFDGLDVIRRQYLLNLICSDTEKNWLVPGDSSNKLPEIVFRSIPPRDEINFLISFLLRFGNFHTELDLMVSSDLRDSFVLAGIVEQNDAYNHQHVDALVTKYIQEELVFLPGGVITFSAKLMSAKIAFEHLLGVGVDIVVPTAQVLVEKINVQNKTEVEEFVKRTQEQMFNRVRELGIPNLPLELSTDFNYWEPLLVQAELQESDSFLEQRNVFQKIKEALLRKFSGDHRIRHQIILGNPGTGKTHLTGLILSHAVCNGFMSYVTSLASRRAEQLHGEHAHRLFKISTKNLDVESLASEAVLKLNHDHKRRTLLLNLQVLIVEEISLLNAELWCTMDLILRKIKENEEPFGGVFVVANGDCCQLPNISGLNIFEAFSFLFSFDFHFLQHFVRMVDPIGQELLRLLERRPLTEDDISRVVEIISNSCNFVGSWNDIHDAMIMKVFGKRVAEQEATEKYFEKIEGTDMPFRYSYAQDQICTQGNSVWRTADNRSVTNYLNYNVSEYEKLLFHPSCVLRATQNLKGIQQGQLCVLDFNSVTDNCVFVFVAPNIEAVTQTVLDNGDYLQWRRVKVRKTPGYVQNYLRNSVRRFQFPLCNYVALTVHKLMGDTFAKLATSLSSVERKFALWLISQFYVIVSRVKYLNQLFFVGEKRETIDAIRTILRKRNLVEEQIFNLFQSLKRSASNSRGPAIIETPSYLRHHFDVPQTPNGYVSVFVSNANRRKNIFLVRSCSNLSSELRRINSTDVCDDPRVYPNQPWAMGFFYWNFCDEEERLDVSSRLQDLYSSSSSACLRSFLTECQTELQEKVFLKMCICCRIIPEER